MADKASDGIARQDIARFPSKLRPVTAAGKTFNPVYLSYFHSEDAEAQTPHSIGTIQWI